MSRVALIEDHQRLAEMVRQALSAAGIEADLFSTVSEASYGVNRGDYAVLIVDRGLPDGDGLAFLRALRAAGVMTPCLMLTARDALHDRVDGLESGADDYVTKPFAMSELVARVRTLMRRPPMLRDWFCRSPTSRSTRSSARCIAVPKRSRSRRPNCRSCCAS